jgi:hypothetical protein
VRIVSKVRIVLVVLVLLASGGALVWELRSGNASSGRDAPASVSELRQAQQLLDRHAEALLTRNATAWNAALDQSRSAADYRRHELDVFDNLVDVPLASWSYRVLSVPGYLTGHSDDVGRAVVSAAAHRLAGRVILVQVQQEYRLASVDAEPATSTLWLSLVRRSGGFAIAADFDAAAVGLTSAKGPWDYGRLLATVGPHSVVLAHADQRQQLGAYRDMTEAAIPVINAVWTTPWAQQVAVVVASTAAEFGTATGASADTASEVAAAAVSQTVTSTGVVVGGRIVINAPAMARLSSADQVAVLRHELTHLATRASTSSQTPRWLSEGFADYVGYLNSAQPVATIAAELAGSVRRAGLPTDVPSDADFDLSGSGTGAQIAYQQAWLLCRDIASRYTATGLTDFYRAVATNGLDAALAQVLHMNRATLISGWLAEIDRELRTPQG